ncbi:22668_t:CDS:2, partial [Racocetra persica]
VNSPELKRKQQNFSPFQEHFNRSGSSDVVSFNSLSRDAVLVSPIPVIGHQYDCDYSDNEIRDYKDIAGFSTDAPQCQWNSFWQRIAVNYCHMRIDSRPKYYEHQEYLTENANQNRHERPQIQYVNLSALKEQAISEINGELAKKAIEGYKREIFSNIKEIREAKVAQRQSTKQLIAEINRLKSENERLRNNQNLTSSERQNRLQQNQQKLEQIQRIFDSKDTQQQPTNNNFPTSLVCVPVSSNTIDKEFEFVLVKSEALNSIRQDYSSFQEHFRKSSDNQAVSFLSFSGDTLIVPVPKVGEKMEENLINANGATRWLSTSGLGISYLHVRIDRRPKYYSHQEYLTETQQQQEIPPKNW